MVILYQITIGNGCWCIFYWWMVSLTNYYIYNWVNNNQVVNKFEGYNYG
jgi:hypothetical protein